jgi:alkylation response protein AidB-like acyl-CoA dehydrogenase
MVHVHATVQDQKRLILVKRAEDIAEILTTQAPADEANGTLTPETVDALYKAGVFGLKLPAVIGGDEADPVTQTLVIEALSNANAAAGWCAMVGATSAALPGAFLADEAIAEMFLPGRVPKCAIAAMAIGKAEIVSGGYRLTGRWPFASGIRHSEWITAGATVVRDGKPEHFLMTFRTKSARIHDNWQVAGLKGTGSCDFSVDNLFVPSAFTWALLTDPPKRGGPLYRIANPGFVANEHAGFAVGLARRAMDAFLEKEVARGRSYVPGAPSMSARQSVQRALGASEIKLRAARNAALDVNGEVWQATCNGQPVSLRRQCELRAVATYCTEMALEIVTELFRFSGGGAIYEKNILQQCLRDINAAAQHLMVSEISYENLGQVLLGVTDLIPMR